MNNDTPNETYKTVKRVYDNLLRDNKLQKFKQKVTYSDNKSKSLWSGVKEIKGITGKTMQAPGDLIKIAGDFSTYLQTLDTNNLHQVTINTHLQHSLLSNVNSFTLKKKKDVIFSKFN
ncbi:hypothetical protein WA026_016210 [Henosepilachna vigintioctopunctata]|uniref:Uncharacterized protein n=1 Tax=Henosepilachna vigintioctopunctata TaxID=420089 RepID=A0AAW1TLB4_9CUCU